MQKTVLIIAAGYFQIPAIRAAKSLGHYVIATDISADAPGFRYADETHVISSRDVKGILSLSEKISEKRKIDAVLTMGTDVSQTVAFVADKFGLPGIHYSDAISTSVNKKNMRYRFLEHNLPQPQFFEVNTLAEAGNIASFIGYPVVVKPVDAMGARGVMKVDGKNELPYAFREAMNASLEKKEVLIEEFIPGEELSIDCLVSRGKVHFLCIGDRLIRFPPYFVEIGHNVPSQLPEEDISAACDVMIRSVRALKITDGAAKGDIKINRNGVFIGEIAGRLSGGFMSSHTLPLSTGIDAAKAAVQIALGEIPDLSKKASRAAVERAIIPPPGKVTEISGVTEAQSISGVAEVHINCRVGDVLEPLKSNIGKAGNIVTYADDLATAVKIAEKALSTIKIITV